MRLSARCTQMDSLCFESITHKAQCNVQTAATSAGHLLLLRRGFNHCGELLRSTWAVHAGPNGSPPICIPNVEFTLQLTHLQPATYPITSCPPPRHCLLCLHSFLPAAQLISHRVARRGASQGCSAVDADVLATILTGNSCAHPHTGTMSTNRPPSQAQAVS